MALNPDNARIFGSDLDSISLAPVGTPLPSTISGALDGAFEDVGWLHSDGVTETFTGSKSEIRGHQNGGGVVRSFIDSTGTQIQFSALEDKPQTQALRYWEKSVTSSDGVRTSVRSPGQRVARRAAVVDLFDRDNTTVKTRIAIPVFEVVPNGDRVFVASDIAAFPFLGEVLGDYTTFQSSGSAKTSWTVTIVGTPTGGTYTLSLNGATTAPIAYNATNTAIAAALNALSGVTGMSGITASGSGPFTVTLPAAGTLTGNGALLTGGTSPAVTVA